MYTWPLYRFANSLRWQPSWLCKGPCAGAAAAAEAVSVCLPCACQTQAAEGAVEANVGANNVLAGSCACWAITRRSPSRGGTEGQAEEGGSAPGLCRMHVDALDSIRPLKERALQASMAPQCCYREHVSDCTYIHKDCMQHPGSNNDLHRSAYLDVQTERLHMAHIIVRQSATIKQVSQVHYQKTGCARRGGGGGGGGWVGGHPGHPPPLGVLLNFESS